MNIDPKYDVVLTYSPIIEVSGHLFECFDYYLFLHQYCKVGILFFGNVSKDKLRILWNTKYNVPFDVVMNDIICIDCSSMHTSLVNFSHKTSVIVVDGNIRLLNKHRIFLNAKKMYGFMCEDLAEPTSLNMVYLYDYRIYGKKPKFNSIDYVKKLPFKFYRKSKPIDKKYGMIYMTYVCRKIDPTIVVKYHLMSQCEKTMLIVPYKLPEYGNLPNIFQVEAPVEDIFDKFGTYIYTPVNRRFDCSPRLVTECFMHNKSVFKQLDYYDVGLETRYNDCVTNLNSLDLTDNDKILEILGIR